MNNQQSLENLMEVFAENHRLMANIWLIQKKSRNALYQLKWLQISL